MLDFFKIPVIQIAIICFDLVEISFRDLKKLFET